MNGPALVGVVVVTAATFGMSAWWARSTRTTSDFQVARQPVRTGLNAFAVSGEYLAVASFLGITGAVLTGGSDALWYPLGFTAGYVAVLLFVAAPLRRSGAYTLPDFVETRLDSPRLRRLAAVLVVLIGWLYLVPQVQGAGRTLALATGLSFPGAVLVVLAVIAGSVLTGGIRAATFVQAVQYGVKLFAVALPAFVLVSVFLADGPSRPVAAPPAWTFPGDGSAGGMLHTYSLILALFLGTMGLPQVLARFYANPSGRSARRTTLLALALLGVFYVFPGVLGWLARQYLPGLVGGNSDDALLLLPSAVLPNWVGHLLGAVTAAGAFAAFLATSVGLVLSVVAVLCADLLPARELPGLARGAHPRLRRLVLDRRVVAVLSAVVPALLALAMDSLSLAQAVGAAFALAASTFCPLLLLGIWWRGLTEVGAAWGLLVGGSVTVLALGWAVLTGGADWAVQPALVSVPAAVLAMIIASRATRDSVPTWVGRTMLRLHAPDRLGFLDEPLEADGVPRTSPSGAEGGSHRRE